MNYRTQRHAVVAAVSRFGQLADRVEQQRAGWEAQFGEPTRESAIASLTIDNRLVLSELPLTIGELGRVVGGILNDREKNQLKRNQ